MVLPLAPNNTNVVAPGGMPETRNIVIAQGIQFTNTDMRVHEPFGVFPDALTAPTTAKTTWKLISMRKRAPLNITTQPDGTYQYVSDAQGVTFSIKLVTTKDAFRAALLTANNHVAYDGHARYGRGPCFGQLASPGVVSATEDFENGSDPTTTGIFRMGFPYIGIPISEILEYGYTATLVDPTTKVQASMSDPFLRPYVGSLTPMTAGEIETKGNVGSGLLLARISDKDPTKKWLAYQGLHEGALVWCVVLTAGWTGTTSAPADLGATTPLCRVFCHFGCKSFRLNHPILRGDTFKGWKRNGDDKFAYWTTGPYSTTGTLTYWLYHLLTYPTQNANLDWGPSIAYAVSHCNADLAQDGAVYTII